jgi:N-dimethylarginine dimethylaminohydrolase
MTETDPTLSMSDGLMHQILGPEPTPAFGDKTELTATWGRPWGAADDVSRLRLVVMRPPAAGLGEVAQLGEAAWAEAAQAYVDPNRNWYWAGRELPDLDRLHAEHAAFASQLEAHGVEVILAPQLSDHHTKAVFTRDPLFTVRGGSVIARMAPRMRRGEEQAMTRVLAEAGAPILGTIGGTGVAEGGSFVKVRPDKAFFGTSVRCNAEGHRQLRAILQEWGVDVARVNLPGYQIHLDIMLAMIDDDLALVNPRLLPYDTQAELRQMGVELVETEPGEDWACNMLTLERRKVFFPAHLPRTADKLNSAHNVEVIPVPYREMNKNGGGIHCSTHELVRDW